MSMPCVCLEHCSVSLNMALDFDHGEEGDIDTQHNQLIYNYIITDN